MTEEYVWDGLALLWRDGTGYAAEPHPSGGSIVASFSEGPKSEPTYHINDLLGTTLAVVRGDQIAVTPLTAFGKPVSHAAETPAEEPPQIKPSTAAAPPMTSEQ